MKKSDFTQNDLQKVADDANQRGSALVIAVLILALISVFVALALSRSSAEAAAVGNETSEGRTFYAAQGSLEMMTRNFNKIFETKINPTDQDITNAQIRDPQSLGSQFSQYDFDQTILKTSISTPVVLPGGPYAGLNAIRDNWRLRTVATDKAGIQVQLTRNLLNNRIPIFQFGIFYDDDLELYRPPRFSFGGRVHTNGNFFLSPGDEGVYFDSRVTAVGQVITQTWRNGYTGDSAKNKTYIKNASAQDKQLFPDKASVLNTSAGSSDNIFASQPDMPPSKLNATWATDKVIFDGNLQTTGPGTELNLPVKIGTNVDLVEMIKRGKKIASSSGGDLFQNAAGNLAPVTVADDDILKAERYANKTGIRVSLSDSKAKLPGCASGVSTTAIAAACGVRLDGLASGAGDVPASGALSTRVRGYQPKLMKSTTSSSFNYTPTRVNGERLYTGREVWIKVETVSTDASNGAIITKDITQDFLSLGMTEQAIAASVNISSYSDQSAPDNRTDSSSRNIVQTAPQAPSTGVDSRSIIKVQRFTIPGPEIVGGSSNYLNYYTLSSGNFNAVVRYSNVTDAKLTTYCSTCTAQNNSATSPDMESYGHLKRAAVNGGSSDKAVVPFPIEMFDTREGTFYDYASIYTVNKVTKMGAMSMVDIDVANLRRFLRGDFNGLFPTDTPFAQSNGNVGLKNTDIPDNAGWVLYVSDRRGDADFDGEFDMEDIYGYGYNSSTSKYYGCDGVKQPGEDVNKNGILDTDFGNEAPNKYDDDIYSDLAAVTDLPYYRRGIRLINGSTIPGNYDSTTPANTKGFTLASENGVYVLGNYNATGVTSVPSTGNTPYTNYLPATTSNLDIPASIAGDAVTILSNSWNDAESFAYPYDLSNRKASDTTMRFAMLSGDTISNIQNSINQGGISPQLNGGVHNFKRFLERWTDPANTSTFSTNLNYTGSLINLFNSHNNNGSFKCCNTVYNPPVRNWVFDSTFLDADRLPPGTPFFQYVQITGFERTNE